MLVERVVGDAGDDRERDVAEPRARGPAQVGAAVVAAEVDHTAGMQRARLRPDRNRLVLDGAALAGVDQRAQRLDIVDATLPDDAELRLVDGLPGVELDRHRVDAPRVGVELGVGEAERVLRLRQRDVVDDQRQRVIAVVPDELGIGDVALGGTVLAVAVGAKWLPLTT